MTGIDHEREQRIDQAYEAQFEPLHATIKDCALSLLRAGATPEELPGLMSDAMAHASTKAVRDALAEPAVTDAVVRA